MSSFLNVVAPLPPTASTMLPGTQYILLRNVSSNPFHPTTSSASDGHFLPLESGCDHFVTLLDLQYGRKAEYRSTSAIIEYMAWEGYGSVRDALSVCVGGVMNRLRVGARVAARGTKTARVGVEIRRAFIVAVVGYVYAIVSLNRRADTWQLCRNGFLISWISVYGASSSL